MSDGTAQAAGNVATIAPIIASGGTNPLAWFQAASPILSKALGGSGDAAPAGPSSASGFYAPNTYDGSNWTVTTSGSNASVKADSAAGASGGSAASGGLLGSLTSSGSLPFVIGAALVALVLWKRL